MNTIASHTSTTTPDTAGAADAGPDSPVAVTHRLLTAISRCDVDAMMAELDPEVVCEFPTAPGDGPRSAVGIPANRAFYCMLRPMWSRFTLTRAVVRPLADDPHHVIADYASEGTLIDGSPYRNTYLVLAEVRDGKITRWREFCDPAPVQRGISALTQPASPASND